MKSAHVYRQELHLRAFAYVNNKARQCKYLINNEKLKVRDLKMFKVATKTKKKQKVKSCGVLLCIIILGWADCKFDFVTVRPDSSTALPAHFCAPSS